MPIHLEQRDKHTIQSYSTTVIRVDDKLYHQSTIISPDRIIENWSIHSLQQLTENALTVLLTCQPEIIIIGHDNPKQTIPISTHLYLAQQPIGIECMTIGAACRTFNILLSEQRRVVAGIILKKA